MTRVAAILKSLQWTLRVISQSPNPAIQALREKFGFVGNTPSNVETILHQLKTNEPKILSWLAENPLMLRQAQHERIF